MRAILICALALSGCATAKQIHLPSGDLGYAVECDGAALSWNLCYEKAGEICGAKGYDVLTKDGSDTPLITGTQYGVVGSSQVTRSMLIHCKT